MKSRLVCIALMFSGCAEAHPDPWASIQGKRFRFDFALSLEDFGYLKQLSKREISIALGHEEGGAYRALAAAILVTDLDGSMFALGISKSFEPTTCGRQELFGDRKAAAVARFRVFLVRKAIMSIAANIFSMPPAEGVRTPQTNSDGRANLRRK